MSEPTKSADSLTAQPKSAPIFPIQDCGKWQWLGIRERDLFAAMILQGLVVSQPDCFEISESERKCRIAVLALQAVQQSEALILELGNAHDGK